MYQIIVVVNVQENGRCRQKLDSVSFLQDIKNSRFFLEILEKSKVIV